MLARTLPILLLLNALVFFPRRLDVAWAQTGRVPIRVQIESILAADTNGGIDERLATMAGRFKAAFHFTSYRLLSRRERRIVIGQMVAANLPGGLILNVVPNGVDGDMITMELMLFDGPRLEMRAGLKLPDHGVLIIGGPHYKEGMLLLAISCARLGSMPRHPQPQSRTGPVLPAAETTTTPP